MGLRLRLSFKGRSVLVDNRSDKPFPYIKYEFIIRNLAYRFGIPGVDIDDLVQLAYLKLYTVMSKFDPNLSSEKTWVVNVVKNMFRDVYRRTIAEMSRNADGKRIFTISIDEIVDKEGDIGIEDETSSPEDLLIMEDLINRIKLVLDPFEQLVLECKLRPESVFDAKQQSLCARAIKENKRRPDKKLSVRITETTIASHLSSLLEMKITRGEIHYAMRKIKDATLQVIYA